LSGFTALRKARRNEETATAAPVAGLRMGRFRQGLIARRAALSVFALYALLLQAFLLTASPNSHFARPDASASQICSFGGSDPQAPGKSSHHGLCCILACAVAGGAYLGAPSAAAPFPEQSVSSIRFGFTQKHPGPAPPRHYFAARAPPPPSQC